MSFLAVLSSCARAHQRGLGVRSDVFDFGPYPDGSTMSVALAGNAGDSARITYIPRGADTGFHRYQGFINQSALTTTEKFTVSANTSAYTILVRPGWSLNISRLAATAALSVGGTVVSADVRPPTILTGSDKCDPPGWKGLSPGIGSTVASSGTCIRCVFCCSYVIRMFFFLVVVVVFFFFTVVVFSSDFPPLMRLRTTSSRQRKK